MALRDKLRVLVVDDMSTSRGILLQGLDILGIRDVRYAENGSLGLAQTRKDMPNLILSDLYMPEMNGFQFLQQIRNDAATAKIGFILVTGRGEKNILETGGRLGMNNYLLKPYSVEQLRDCIESVVGRL